MTVIAVLGAHWGDEGKGKVAAGLSTHAAACARFQGGPNAGHTLVLPPPEGEICLRMVPSGVISGARGIIGGGCVVEPRMLLDEVARLRRWVPGLTDRLLVSERAHVILDSHLERDRAGSGVGSTRMGVGPTYGDKALRSGLRVADLLTGRGVPDEMRPLAEEFAEVLGASCGDDHATVRDLLDRGERVIAEGAQGARLDIDHGDYPNVTSSNTTIGAVLTGLGAGPGDIGATLVTTAAYVTKVGGGRLPSRVPTDLEELLRTRGREVDGATGLLRDVGWLDVGWLRTACRINQADALALTKVDVLAGLERVGLYDDARTDRVEMLDGWSHEEVATSDESGPLGAFLERVEEAAGCPVSVVSTGPGQDEWWARDDQARAWGVPDAAALPVGAGTAGS